MLKFLRDYINDAEQNHTALGHFNISNIEGFWAVVRAAKELNLPVIIGVSEGERDFIGVKQVKALVDVTRQDLNHPIFLNADHTYSLDRAKEAIDAGFDGVIIDGAKLSFEENFKLTKECVEYAQQKNKNILVEGELGYIGQSSKVLDSLPEGVTEDSLTTPEEAKEFVRETGIDLFAPAVGNVHGMLKNGNEPKLNISLIKEIRGVAGVPLVLHGGSGNTNKDLQNAIDAGVSIIHINTELRVAYISALKKELQENPEEVAPYKVMRPSVIAMQEVIEEKLSLFNKL